MSSIWLKRIVTFLLWAFAGAVAVFWAIQVATQNTHATAATRVATTEANTPSTDKVAQALGAKPALNAQEQAASNSAQTAGRFQLLGVLASKVGNLGVGLIAIDGKPAKPYRVGAAVDEGLRLKAVAGRSAVLAYVNGTYADIQLEMPKIVTTSKSSAVVVLTPSNTTPVVAVELAAPLLAQEARPMMRAEERSKMFNSGFSPDMAPRVEEAAQAAQRAR